MSSLRSAGFWGAGLSPAAAEFSAALTCAGCIAAFAPFPATAEGQVSEEETPLRPTSAERTKESWRADLGSCMEVAGDRQLQGEKEMRAATEHAVKAEKGAGRKQK